MPPRKRPRKELEVDDSETKWQVENADGNTHRAAQGLCQLWAIDSKEVQKELNQELRSLIGLCRNKGLLNRGRKKEIRLGRELVGKELNSLWDVIQAEAQQDLKQRFYPPTFQPPTLHHHSGCHYYSTLQKRLLENSAAANLSPRLKKYLGALTVLEYEADHGSMTAGTDSQITMVGESCWTPLEKYKFFTALERCGRFDVEEINRRVGSTKTVAEVYEYLQLLDKASKGIGKDSTLKPLTAREMSPFYILQESRLGIQLQQALETESYGKHLNLLEQPNIKDSNQLLEIWNMSSLTRLFAGISDMTILSSATYNFTQLIKYFISDIMVDLHTQLLNSTDKTVTRSIMNLTIARRQQKKDRRLQDMDIMALLDRRFEFHSRYSGNRSASFLAKRRRIAYEHDPDLDEEEEQGEPENEQEEADYKIDEICIHAGDDEQDIRWEGEQNHLSSEEEKDEDDGMLNPVDREDEVLDTFVTAYDQAEYRYILKKQYNMKKNQAKRGLHGSDEDEDQGNYLKEIEMELQKEQQEEQLDTQEEVESDDGDEDEDEEKEEEEMKRLDKLHEEEMTKFLEFFTEKQAIKEYMDTHQNARKLKLPLLKAAKAAKAAAAAAATAKRKS